MDAETTVEKQRGRPFAPGQSGNPKGRPRGSRDRRLAALDDLLGEESVSITRTVIELASKGKPFALKMVFDRLHPVPRERRIKVALSEAADPASAAEAVIDAVVQGTITPGEGRAVMDLLEAKARLVDVETMRAELAELRELLEQERQR